MSQLSFKGWLQGQIQVNQWPGNVRELDHVIKRSVVMSDNEILALSLPAPCRNRTSLNSRLKKLGFPLASFQATRFKLAKMATRIRASRDEAVQMHGGYGYIDEYQVQRLYRSNLLTLLKILCII